MYDILLVLIERVASQGQGASDFSPDFYGDFIKDLVVKLFLPCRVCLWA